jgi:hypothetical protein
MYIYAEISLLFQNNLVHFLSDRGSVCGQSLVILYVTLIKKLCAQ